MRIKTTLKSSLIGASAFLMLASGAALSGQTPAAAAASTATASPTGGHDYTATFGFANIGRVCDADAAIGRVRNDVPGTVRFQNFAEINEGTTTWKANGCAPIDERPLLAKHFGPAWRTSAGDERVQTRAMAKNWKVLGVSNWLGHPGIDRISPERRIIVTRYQHADTGQLLAVITTHTVAGAFNGRQDAKDPLRVEYWYRLWDRLDDRVDTLVSQGHDVVVTGDFNRQGIFTGPAGKPLKLHWREKLVKVSAMDRIYAIPAPGRTVRVEGTGSPLASAHEKFHRAIWARLSFADAD